MITRWNPFRDIEQLHQEINRLFEGIDNERRPFSHFSFLPGRAARSYPLININEEGEGYEVAALAPGIAPESVKVSVAKNQLTIEGEKTAVENVKTEDYHRSERSAGKFVRTLTLPADIDSEKVEATYQNGLLRIKLPKAESAKPRQINVNMN